LRLRLAVVVSVLAAIASHAAAQTQCNPRDLAIPSTVTGSITISSCKNTSDYYDVYLLKNMVSGRKLRFTLTKNTLPTMYLQLQRVQDLKIVTIVNKSEYSANTMTMDVEIPVTQDTYSLFVHTITSFGTGSYTLSVADLDTPNQGAQVVPIVGHLAGSGGSEFRSDLKLSNTTGSILTGRLLFTARGQSPSAGDPSVPFSVPAHGVTFFEDVYLTGFPGGSGAARVVVLPDNSAAGALIVDTSTYTATPGGGELGQNPTVFTEAAYSGAGTELLGILGKSVERTNVLVMAGPAETTIRFQYRDAAGTVVKSVTRTFPHDSTSQFSAPDLLGLTPAANGSLEAQIQSGSARVALSPVNNVTNQGRWVDFKPMP
jgi:hypothetical protein